MDYVGFTNIKFKKGNHRIKQDLPQYWTQKLKTKANSRNTQMTN